jgi:DNA-binding MarR family transcriptional regulator
MGSDPSTAPDDGLLIQSLLQALETFLKLRGPIPLRELVIFLHIALDEGNEAIEYADRLKIHRAAMSKYVHDLADRARGGGPGLGLIEFRYTGGNLHNRKPIFLTKKGRSVAAVILKSLRSPYPPLASLRR